jgi:hypothetical protein
MHRGTRTLVGVGCAMALGMWAYSHDVSGQEEDPVPAQDESSLPAEGGDPSSADLGLGEASANHAPGSVRHETVRRQPSAGGTAPGIGQALRFRFTTIYQGLPDLTGCGARFDISISCRNQIGAW